MDSSVVQDTLDRKVKEDTLDLLAYPLFHLHHGLWKKENQEPQELAAYLVSLDPEVTKVCQVCPVVRVCLDFPAMPSRVKDSQDSLGSQGVPEPQASLDQRERLEFLDSLAHLDQGVMTAHLVYLEILENLVVLVAKVNREIHLVILEVQELKANLEIQASQVAVPMTVPPVTTAFREVQVSLDLREVLVKQAGLE